MMTMLRYRLDDLGSYQFEKLVQSLLKAHAGLAVESWGNRGDFGRDAYTPNPLKYPEKDAQSDGPFLFQVKFVEGANSAGAKPKQALMASISKEIAEIDRRKKQPKWKIPAYFTFITNSLIDSDTRERIRIAFGSVLQSSKIIVWGGDDICDVLDQSPTICRSFPQLLSIRDLDALIRNALAHESLMRSEAAIDKARELVPIFAPTSNYERAWAILRKHHFAVLQGPPEVGKSAIAWMIGLSQAAIGWEAVYSRTPEEFFKMYDHNKEQVFIADDAFGRTEYDPARTSIWEAELEFVLHKLDPRHWLMWTSRKHILERAVARMDVTGRARSFPDPGAVLVDVQSLTVEERALVLFRHSRAANLEDDCKQIIQVNALSIVHDPDFTPERMRRFVEESLPNLAAQFRAGTLREEDLKVKIREAIRNPTKQMQLTFRYLETGLKWYLIALLEQPEISWVRSGGLEALRHKYEAYCPAEKHVRFEDATLQLQEAFIRIRKSSLIGRKADVDWIHPSYRDLVIDELTADSELRTRFLRHASLEGIKIAVSDTGGSHGQRHLPFMLSNESWRVLQDRCLAIIKEGSHDRPLLEVLSSAAEKARSLDISARWNSVLVVVCNAIKAKWDKNEVLLTTHNLMAFIRARAAAKSPIEIPDLIHSWNHLEEAFYKSVNNHDFTEVFDFQPLDDLTAFATAVKKVDPVFLVREDFPDKFNNQLAKVFEAAQSEIDADGHPDDPEKIREIAGSLSEFSNTLDRVSTVSEKYEAEAYEYSQKLADKAAALESVAQSLDPPEPDFDDYDHERSHAGNDNFDIHALFAEL